jgi:peptide deformylase
MRLQISYYGNPILRKKCALIDEVTPEIQQLAKDMLETTDASAGIGLAAPQIGHAIRLFVCRFYENTTEFTISEESYVFINPKITLLDRNTETHDEGCLSVPGILVPVARPLKLIVEALDINGQPFQLEREGYNARVVLHENDHLNGVLHIDRTDPATRKKVDPHLHMLKKKYKN